MNLEGSVIGNRYKVQEKIGNGGMATVYKALDQVLNRYVAIKVLREEFTTDEEFIKRFNAEAQSAARLTHPNIVSVFDVGQEYNIYYIVMELIQGKTLKQIIEEDGCLPYRWAINIATQIASALEMAHKNHIIHRDIKPHNIMITEDGVAKVTDFGIAKAVSNSTITAFGTTLGSVHYFSPEHARGGYTDAKSDLYSLGVVMYEMLTGKVPFDADTPVSIALKHMQEDPVEPIKINKDIPFALNQIIMKAMKKDPNERYQNATEIIRDLNMALKNPDGGFVKDTNYEGDFTKRIPTIESKEEFSSTKQRASDIPEKHKTKIGTFFAEHPKTKVILIIAIFIIVFVATLVITLTISNSSSSKNKSGDVQIPNVVGISQDEAKKKVEELKLKYNVRREEYNADVETGFIISQDPEYINNYSVKEGSTVNVVVSKGKQLVKMPKVIGMEYSEAEKSLRDLGLKIEKVEEISQKVQEGYVISQENAENTDVEAGATVKIHVSKGNGIKKVTVTSVVGKDKEAAKSELTELGLEVNIVEEENTAKSDGVVLKQSIDVGTVVEEGTAITLTVNKIEQNKQGTVNINVKSLVATYAQNDDEDDEKNNTVSIRAMVGSDTVYDKKVSKDTENINFTVEGKGNISVKVYINGILVNGKTYTMDLNSENTVLNVK